MTMMNRIAMLVLDIVFLPDLLRQGERSGVAWLHVCHLAGAASSVDQSPPQRRTRARGYRPIQCFHSLLTKLGYAVVLTHS
jgi:hypothetical protein